MHMAALPADQSSQTVDENSAKKLIEKLLRKKYAQLANDVSTLSNEQKECIKSALHKSYFLSIMRVKAQQILSGHTDEITSAKFSNDGRFALTGSRDTTARLWDLTKTPITSQKLTGHSDVVTSVAFSNDSRFALTGSRDATACLWDLTTNPFTSQILAGHTKKINSVAFSPDGHFALTGSNDNTARLWDLSQSSATSQQLVGHTGLIDSVAFSHDGRFALTGSKDTTARLWDLTKSPIISTELTGHTGLVVSVAFNGDGRFALTASWDRTARLWDLTKSPVTSQQLAGHKELIACAALSNDGCFALTGSADYTARLWDLTKSPITSQELRGHRWPVVSVAFSPNGRFALTGSFDTTARLWDLAKTADIGLELRCHSNWISTVAFSKDGRLFLTGSYDKTACLFKIETADTTALALEDVMLIVKLITNEDSLKDDFDALERLNALTQIPEQQSPIIKIVTDFLYRMKLPEKECWICSEKYDPASRVCMKLLCCPKIICKICLEKLGRMSYSTECAGYQFQQAVKAKCPFCNKPADQMGTIKKFKIDDPNNRYCSSCDKEKCTLKCGGCKTEFYCSKECQAKDWPAHRTACKKK